MPEGRNTEDSPLLGSPLEEERYREKLRVLGTLGLAGFASTCSFWTYYIQWHDMLLLLGIPDTIESFSSDLLRFCAATLGVLFSSVYSATHGKTRVLAGALLVQTVGSLLIVSSQSTAWLLLGQTVQYFGIAPVWSTGIGIVGEHFGSGMKGKAIGLYLFASMAGAAIAPFLCLLIRTHIAPMLSVSPYQSWRLTEGFIGAPTLISWLLVRRLPPSTVFYDVYRSHETSPVEGTSSNGQHSNGQQSISAALQNGRNGATPSTSGVADTLSQAHARSMNPFEPLSLLRLRNVVALSYASGAPIYASIALLWMEVSQFDQWTLHLSSASDKIAFRRFLPVGMLGMGWSLVSGFLIDLYASRSRHVSPQRFLFRASLGTLLLPVGLLIVGFTLKSAMELPIGGDVALDANDTFDDGVRGDRTANLSPSLVGVFLSGFGAYSPVVPCMTYFLELVPSEKNMQILASSDALQLLSALSLLMLYMVFAQGLGMDVANTIAAGGVSLGFWLLWKVSRRSLNEQLNERLESRED
ncbi:major facilitator superfamily domain-containing protein [Coprinopsis sp. MPI-PUGE-AT-0042]|nr:major facilitator superfamily domain-containing protein [Coprinopsis sp. MPI-PUGE-AT-0042]